jgi:hypothetical protein
VVHIVVDGYIVDHYCLMLDRGVVHIVVAGYIVAHYCLMFDRGVVHIVVSGYIVDHYCLMFHRGVVKHEIQNLSLTYQMKVCYYQHIGPGNMSSLLLMVCNTLYFWAV